MMRMNTRGTNRIAKRTLAMILSVTMILGSTITVFASEEGNVEEPVEVQAVQAAEVAAVGENPTEEEHGGAAGVIEEAIGESVEIFEVSPELAQQLADGLTYVAGGDLPEKADGKIVKVDGVSGNLETAGTEMMTAVTAFEEQKELVGQAESENTQAETAINNANTLIDTANNSQNAAEASAAQAAAQAQVNTAKALVDNTQQKVDKLQEEWDKTNKERIDAQAAADKALQEAKNNAGSAAAALAAAKAAAERVAKLMKIEEEYRELMIHYYRDDKIKSAVYNLDGTINLEESAKKAYETGKVDFHPDVDKNKTMALARELMRQLIEYKLYANGATEIIEFAKEETDKNGKVITTAKNALEGEIVDNKQSAFVLQEDGTVKEMKNQVVERTVLDSDTEYTQHWYNANLNKTFDNGRSNRVKVVYKDKDGNEVTEYYNYILKAATYGNKDKDIIKNGEFVKSTEATAEEKNAALEELKKGPIYLAMINEGQVDRDEDAYNYDDYQKLTEAVNALGNLEDAQKAVAAAQEKVDALKAQVDELSNVSFDEKEMADLLARLNAAKEEKVRLEGELKEAEERLNSIDLSRFEVTPADTDDAPSTGADTAAGVAALPMIASPLTITPIGTLATAFAGVAGVAGGAGDAITIGEETLPGAAAPAAMTLEDPELPGAEKAPATLTDGELPGAAGTEETMNLWWLWPLLLLLALIVAYMIYRYNEKKKENNNTVA